MPHVILTVTNVAEETVPFLRKSCVFISSQVVLSRKTNI